MLAECKTIQTELGEIWIAPNEDSVTAKLWAVLNASIKQAMTSTELEVKELACRSHIHDNGFVKLALFDSDDGRYRVRLHIWESSETSDQEANVHDHRYDFISLVVVGGLENVRWKLSDNGTEYKLFTYTPRNEDGVYNLKLVGRQCLSPEPTEVYAAGDSYLMMRDDLHIAQTMGNMRSITLCVQDRSNLKSQAQTLSISHPNEKTNISAPPLSVEVYRQTIRTIYEEEIRPAIKRHA